MIRELGAARPAKGDEVRFDNGRYFLTVREGQPAIFHDGAYLKTTWKALKERRDDNGKLYWVIDSTDPSGGRVQIKPNWYEVKVTLRGGVHSFNLPALSEGRAKNSAAGKLAVILGVTIQAVQAELKRPPNSIEVKLT